MLSGPGALFNGRLTRSFKASLSDRKKKKRWNDTMINWGMDQRQKLSERMKSLIPFASARQS